MSNKCVQCGTEQPVGSQLCNRCGRPYEETSFDEGLSGSVFLSPRKTPVLITFARICLWSIATFFEVVVLYVACQGDLPSAIVFFLVLIALIGFNKQLPTRFKRIGLAGATVTLLGLIVFDQTPKGKANHAIFLRQEAQNNAKDRIQQAARSKEEREHRAEEAKQVAVDRATEARQKADSDLAASKQIAADKATQEVATQNSQAAKIEAYVMAQEFVNQRLKSPGSAVYPDYQDGYVQRIGNNTYQITSYVDSQNGFGALLRSGWTATVQNAGNDRWKCGGVQLFPQ
jgi:hypothetical protein